MIPRLKNTFLCMSLEPIHLELIFQIGLTITQKTGRDAK